MAFYRGKKLLIIKHATSIHSEVGDDSNMGFKRYINIFDFDGKKHVDNKMISEVDNKKFLD